MMARFTISLVTLLVAVMVFGKDGEALEGAWALEETPTIPCLVATNRTVWVKEADCWRPSEGNSMYNTEIGFKRFGIDTNMYEIIISPKDGDINRIRKAGAVIDDGDVVWSEERWNGVRREFKNARKIVRTAMPDWSAVCDINRYVGCWKPMKVGNSSDGDARSKDEDSLLLKIRPDHYMIIRKMGKVEKSKESRYIYQTMKWLSLEGGLRMDFREKYAKDDDPVNCMVRGLWIDPTGRMICYGGREIMTWTRTDEAMEDPIDSRRKMVSEKAYHGFWGVNSEFSIKVFGFDRNGRGVRSGFMMMLPFSWTVLEDGTIHCVGDEEFSLTVGRTKPVTFDCRYDSDRNAMIVMEPSQRDGAGSNETVLPYMGGEEHIAEILKKCDEMKNDPKWKQHVEELRKQAMAMPITSAADKGPHDSLWGARNGACVLREGQTLVIQYM